MARGGHLRFQGGQPWARGGQPQAWGGQPVTLGSLALPSVTQVASGSALSLSPDLSCVALQVGGSQPSSKTLVLSLIPCGRHSLRGTSGGLTAPRAVPIGPTRHEHPALSFSSDKVHPAGIRVPDRPGFPQEDRGGNQEAGTVWREVATGGRSCLCPARIYFERHERRGQRGNRDLRARTWLPWRHCVSYYF